MLALRKRFRRKSKQAATGGHVNGRSKKDPVELKMAGNDDTLHKLEGSSSEESKTDITFEEYLSNSFRGSDSFPSSLGGSMVITCTPMPFLDDEHQESLDDEDLTESGEELTGEELTELEICATYLRSNRIDDNETGMKRLIGIVNRDLINSQNIEGTVAEMLVFEDNKTAFAHEFRSLFLSFICDLPSLIFGDRDEEDDDGCSSYCSEVEDSTGRHSGILKLPAFRILTSVLQLAASSHENFESRTMNLNSIFWKAVFGAISQMLENLGTRMIEASLSLKCLRLLRSIDPKPVEATVRFSLLPHILQAQEYGAKIGNKMLMKESGLILKELS